MSIWKTVSIYLCYCKLNFPNQVVHTINAAMFYFALGLSTYEGWVPSHDGFYFGTHIPWTNRTLSLQLQRCDCAHFNNSFPVSASHLLSPGIWWWLVVTGLTFWHHRRSAKHSHIWSGAMLGWAEETDTVWRNSGDTRSAKWCTNSRHKTSGHPAGGPS